MKQGEEELKPEIDQEIRKGSGAEEENLIVITTTTTTTTTNC